MRKPLNHITKLLFCILFLTACTGREYNTLYKVKEQEQVENCSRHKKIPTIAVGQELCITVTGLNEESAQYFRASSEREGATGIECLYYRVHSDGKVEFPLLGRLPVEGLSLTEAELFIADTLQSLLREPAVRIEYVDYHISLMGEVELPGVYQFNNGEVTLYEAIAEAGGFTQFGLRDNVLIIRETEKGVKHIRFDLTEDEVWNTDYYYLRHNDVIMVSSNSGRIALSNNLPAWGTVLVGLGTVFAIIATTQ